MTNPNTIDGADPAASVHEARRWSDNGWTAQVIKNEDDDGWAVAMHLDGQAEPALVGPWTMGRDKKNPKPLDSSAFNTLVKTAAEVIRRHEQHLQASLHKEISVEANGQRVLIKLDITPDDDMPTTHLSAISEAGANLAQVSVSPGFKLDCASATAWIATGYLPPRGAN